MNVLKNKRWKMGGWGWLSVILLVIAFVYLPSVWLRWNYHYYLDQRQARQFKEAQTFNPFVGDAATLERHLQYQTLMRAAGEKEVLERQYREYTRRDPSNAFALALQARITRNPTRQRDLLDQAEQADPWNQAVLVVRVEEALAHGRAREAIERCRRLLRDSWLKPCLLARAYQCLHDWDAMRKEYQNALAYPDAPVFAAIAWAESWNPSHRSETPFDPFASISKEKIEREPLARAYQIFFSQESVSDWMRDLPADVLYDPDSLIVLTRAAIEQKEFSTARSLLRRAEIIRAGHPDTLVYRAILALKEGAPDRAEKLLSSPNVDKRLNPAQRRRIGSILVKEGQMELALPHLLKGWDRIPDTAEILVQAGRLFYETGAYSKAVDVLERARHSAFNDTTILRWLGESYIHLNQPEEAKRALGDLLDWDGDNFEAREMIADLYAKEGDINRAISFFDTYIRTHPTSGKAYLKVIQYHLKAGNHENAFSILNKILSMKPEIDNREEVEAMLKELKGQ